MSIEALNWALNLQLDKPVWKAVLIGIANHANPAGQAWPSVARLVLYSGYKDRAIQKAISELEDVGHLSREERSGTTPIYTLHIMHPRTTCTPPPHVVHPNLNRTINKNKMQIDWQPTTEMIEFAHEFIGGSIEDTARRIQDEADRFRDYWIGTGKPMADWSATWRNWIRRSKSIQGSRSSSQSNLSSRVAEGNRARVSGLLDSIYKHEEKFTNQYGSEDGTPRLIKS